MCSADESVRNVSGQVFMLFLTHIINTTHLSLALRSSQPSEDVQLEHHEYQGAEEAGVAD